MNDIIPKVSATVTTIADAQTRHWRRSTRSICSRTGFAGAAFEDPTLTVEPVPFIRREPIALGIKPLGTLAGKDNLTVLFAIGNACRNEHR